MLGGSKSCLHSIPQKHVLVSALSLTAGRNIDELENKVNDELIRTKEKQGDLFWGFANMPGLSLAMPSNFASQLGPLQSGKRGQFDSLNLQAR